ncbi:MAG TPA: protein kinase [Pyrinomonadaceae bacterium]|nr:protein kinase [Pyrinomonadaceae bacterium]
MRAEEWPRVEELFHNVSGLGVAERDEYLARECAGDEGLRREVELLVSASESNPSFMSRPLLSEGLRALYGGTTGSLVGCSLGHYEITRMLDSGGMGGEVYLAEDCRLERPVALKFISNHYAGDEWAREQMMKEARAVARLEHPHICQVYGVEEIGGHHFIVMQYVEGETLASLMRRGSLGLERAAELAEQIAGALTFAHTRGVIHRDVKPQNIMVTDEGQAKVLDFGLAKFVRPQRAGVSGGEDPAQTLHFGDIVGTPAYMSPEQARGEELDFRSDIFSFGVVFYEMLSGRNPFLHDTVEETIVAVGSDVPPPIPSSGAFGQLALRCLAKERAQRPESAAALLQKLRALRPERAGTPRLLSSFPALRRHARSAVASALALLLLLSVFAGYAYRKVTHEHTLAVLPIDNQSDDREATYLSEGLTRSLSDKFSYLPRLRVKLPSVVPSDKNLVQIGRDLRAEAVLSGRIVREGQSLLLRLTLLRVEETAPAWEGTFYLDAANSFVVQDEITREVSSKLGLWLFGDELYRRQTDIREALSLYMRGRYEWSHRKNKDDMQRAIDYLEQAVDKDPSFAKAYAGLADCYTLRDNVAYGTSGVKEAMNKAGYNARKAVEAGDSLPESHTSLGMVKLRYEWDWAGAEREFRRAIELNPDYAPAHYWYSNLLAAMRRFDESIREADAAKSLDPYSPLSHMNYGRAFYYARRYDEAVAYLTEAVGRYPTYPQLPHVLAITLMQQGQYDKAIAMLEAMRPNHSRHVAAALGYAYGRAGRLAEATEVLRDIDRLSTPEEPMPPQEKAFVYIGMGERDEAFARLEEVYKNRFSGLAYLLTEPTYDSLRDDPRFADLARRVNLMP